MKDLEDETLTTNVMIYSLYKSIEAIVQAFSENFSLPSVEIWENDCRETAKKILNEERESENNGE